MKLATLFRMRLTWLVAPLVLNGLLSFHAVGQATQAESASDFTAIDARRDACIARDGSNAHVMACNSVVQPLVDARLNSVY